MDKLDTLNYSYDTLLKAGRIRNKKDFAALLGRDYAGVVAAMGGNPKFLTDSLVSQAVAAVNNVPEGETPPLRVPMIPVEAHAGSLTEFADAVNEYDCEMVVSPVRGAAFAIQVTGDSMAPAYPSGARILCQRINEAAFIEWGKVYLMVKISANAVATLFRLILNVLRVASRCFSSAALAFYEQQSNNNCKKRGPPRPAGLPQHNGT